MTNLITEAFLLSIMYWFSSAWPLRDCLQTRTTRRERKHAYTGLPLLLS